MRRARLFSFLLPAFTLLATSCSEDSDPIDPPDDEPGAAVISQNITTSRTLYADTVYTIRGFIKVADGAVLTIQPGTVIQGDYGVLGSSLFVLRGARIEAQGTAADPIVFTSSRPEGLRQPGDWGGLIIVGNGIINRTGEVVLEGTATGVENPAVTYSGGNNNADSSGTLRYVRVEFAGYATAADAELNTFTFAAVGSGTTLEYLQALSGLDDSFEWFGGAADAKHLVSYEAGDDHFDMSEGYSGRIQNIIGFQSRQVVPRTGAGNVSSDPQGIENDGCNGAGCTSQDATPLTLPMVANFTLVGPPTGIFAGTSGGVGMMLRRGTGGVYVNGVVARWERAGLSLRDQTTVNRATAGDLTLKNVHVAGTSPTFQPQAGATVQGTLDLTANAIEASTNALTTLFTAVPPASPTGTSQLDWSPAAGSAIATGGMNAFTGAIATKAGSFVTPTAYRGAAAPGGTKWWVGWTNYAHN